MTKFKRLFSTPKKAAAVILCILAVTAVLLAGTAFTAGAIAESTSIGAENAKNFAFADAGVDPVSASDVKTKFEYGHGQFVYEVEFTAGNSEYEYWIKSSNGAVVKKKVEIVTRDGVSAVATAKITLDRAKEIALKDAGLSATEVTFTEAKLDMDDGISVYDVEFFANQTEYEYEINAITGVICKKSREVHSTNTPQVPETASEVKEPQDTVKQPAQTEASMPDPQPEETKKDAELIGMEKAKEKALSDAGVSASAAEFTETKLDNDDGIFVYEIEFVTSGFEYDYEINAKTGAVMSREIEAIETVPPQGGKESGYIGIEKAKSVALSHAGVSDVIFTKAKLDHDDGQVVYEIEFRRNGIEYEYTIRAADGFILEADFEPDD